jgi:hypothetical protein
MAGGCQPAASDPPAASTQPDVNHSASKQSLVDLEHLEFQPRKAFDTSGFFLVAGNIDPWPATASLAEIGRIWGRPGRRSVEMIDQMLSQPGMSRSDRARVWLSKVMCLNYEGEAEQAYAVLSEIRSKITQDQTLTQQLLYGVIYFQGVTALRRGENDNCIRCRGESSCILPIAPHAVHLNQAGSRLAIEHFTEYLSRFPEDLEVKWLLNLAHMTLGEYPASVDPRFLISIDRLIESEQDIGAFRDIGHLAGVNRFNQSGGAIMDDFDNDGLLDIAVTAIDPQQPLGLYRNSGDGHFADVALPAGLTGQLGGLYCVQTDYNNDGFLDIFIPRGAWILNAIRPSLVRNNGDGTWADVTGEAGMLSPLNSNSSSWADYDNDGNLDLYVCCERQPNRLYRNRGDGGFDEVAAPAGVAGNLKPFCKGAAWLDYDNDGAVDLFLNYFGGEAFLFHNEGDGHFQDVTQTLAIDGPVHGFSCWAWDYDNDGWLDVFATCYEFSLQDVVKGLIGQPHGLNRNKLWHNRQGQGFEDRTAAAGLDLVFAAMGSNYADFDNDGWLDMYLGTGSPDLAMLVPNRMFRNDGGARFAEITGSSRTGHLQKGHSVACGDWDRDGNIDMFIQMGGPANGDKYHNILFQNPGHDNHWLTVKLVGHASNRAALGARISVTVGGTAPRVIHRHVSSGSSFGANALEQSFGLAQATHIDRLEIVWPATGKRQLIQSAPADRLIVVVESNDDYSIPASDQIALPVAD